MCGVQRGKRLIQRNVARRRYDGGTHADLLPRTPMNSSDDSALAYLEHRALLLLVVAVSFALGWVLLPFYGTLLWSAIIALLFAPLHRSLMPRLRHRRTLAALLTVLTAVVIVVVPFALLSVTLAHEAAGLLAHIESGESSPVPYLRGVFEALPGWVTTLLTFTDILSVSPEDRCVRTRLRSICWQQLSILACFCRSRRWGGQFRHSQLAHQ